MAAACLVVVVAIAWGLLASVGAAAATRRPWLFLGLGGLVPFLTWMVLLLTAGVRQLRSAA